MSAESRSSNVRPLLLLEMNEIPWRVVDEFVGGGECPSLREFLASSRTYTTKTVDSGELSPWVTWPSMHRGMGNDDHGIRNLGQDPKTFKGVPIWEEYRRLGYTIGICGSLQSWPPQDPGTGGFYVPDTFAHDERCIPSRVEPIQEFNLAQVRGNGRVVRRKLPPGKGLLRLGASLLRSGLTMKTGIRVLGQLAGEVLDRTRVARRPIFQTILFWDVYKSLYNPSSPPAFSSFFTNHVAGVMHRYWHHVFPEDFGSSRADRPPPHRKTMDFAMGILDGMIRDILSFQRRNPDLIVAIASSMGQAAVHRHGHEGFEATVTKVERLITACGIREGSFRNLLAMVPQVAVEVPQETDRDALKARLESCLTASGKKLFRTEEIGNTLSITIKTPNSADRDAGGFFLSDEGAKGGRRIDWEAAGVEFPEVDAGTAYHIPEGVLAIRDCHSKPEDSREIVPASEVKDMLLRRAGLPSAAPAVETSRLGSRLAATGVQE